MELSDIINLLMVVGFAIVVPILGAISKSRKNQNLKNKEVADSEQNDYSYMDLSDLFKGREQENMQFSSDENISKIEKSKENVNTNSVKVREKLTDLQNIESGLDLDKEIITRDLNKSKNKGSQLYHEFDIQKAVIYSEILKTKYF